MGNFLERGTVVERSYHILDRSDSRNFRKLAAYLARHGQFLLPWVELVEQSRLAVDELIDVMGREQPPPHLSA